MANTHAFLRLCAALAFAFALGACAGEPEIDVETVGEHLTAMESANPFDLPDLVLTSHEGQPYRLRAETAGQVTLLFFGYTYCPDICPITMAAASAAVAQLGAQQQQRVTTLFVTMDPARDSPERLKSWLTAMDSPALGLYGTLEQVKAVLEGMGMVLPPGIGPQPPASDRADDYVVLHPASLFVVTPDGRGRFVYGSEQGTPTAIAADLHTLLGVAWAPPPEPVVQNVQVPIPLDSDRTAVYARLLGGATDDTLVALRSGGAAEGSLHAMVDEDGLSRMMPAGPLPVPAGETVELRPGQLHGMLEGFEATPEVGGSITLTFSFASGIDRTVETVFIDPRTLRR